ISKSGAKLQPIRGGVNLSEGHAHAQAKDRPLQRDLPPFAGRKRSDNWTMSRGDDVKLKIWRAFDVDDFVANLRSLPAARSLIFALMVKVFDKNVFHVRAEVSEPPGDAAIVPHDNEGQAGKSYSSHVEVSRGQLRLVPN